MLHTQQSGCKVEEICVGDAFRYTSSPGDLSRTIACLAYRRSLRFVDDSGRRLETHSGIPLARTHAGSDFGSARYVEQGKAQYVLVGMVDSMLL